MSRLTHAPGHEYSLGAATAAAGVTVAAVLCAVAAVASPTTTVTVAVTTAAVLGAQRARRRLQTRGARTTRDRRDDGPRASAPAGD